MSETPSTTTNEQIVVHSGGHLKRISTAGLENASYAFKLQDGVLSLTPAAAKNITPTMLVDASGTKPLTTGCRVPVATTNGTKWDKLTLPTDQNDCKAIVYKGVDGWATTSITGGNLLTNLMGLSKSATGDNCYQVYWNAKDSKWKMTNAMTAGMWMLMMDSNGVSYVKIDGMNFMKYCCIVGDTENVLIQYNAKTFRTIPVPKNTGNYSLNVDQNGDVTFSSGTVGSKGTYYYTLQAPANGSSPSITGEGWSVNLSQTNAIACTPAANIKTQVRYQIDARFYAYVDDTAVFDSMTKPAAVQLIIDASDKTGLICEEYLFHPQSNMIEWHFTGFTKVITSTTPDIKITLDAELQRVEFKFPAIIARIMLIEI